MSSPIPMLAELASLFQLRQQVTPDFLERRNVVGCGVGYKIKGDQLTGTPSVVVSVTKKIPESALSPTDVIPKKVDGARIRGRTHPPLHPKRLGYSPRM